MLVALIALAGCNRLGPQWQGWIYPDGSDLTRHVAIGRFDTLEQCRTSARTVLANIHLEEDGEPIPGDYECGKSCKADSSMSGLNVCSETSK